MIEALVGAQFLKTPLVTGAMRAIDRAWFVPKAPLTLGGSAASSQPGSRVRPFPREYEDAEHMMIQGTDVTVTAPHMQAQLLELVVQAPRGVSGGQGKILDIGSGCGYVTAVISAMAGSGSSVIGLEARSQLVDLAKSSVRSQAALKSWLTTPSGFGNRIQFRQGDGRAGLPDEGPFNVIVVGCTFQGDVSPLVDQLAPGGRLVVPMNDAPSQNERGEGENQKGGETHVEGSSLPPWATLAPRKKQVIAEQHLWVFDRSLDEGTKEVSKKKYPDQVFFVPLSEPPRK